MKKLLFFIIISGALLTAGIFGWRFLQRAGSGPIKKTVETSVPQAVPASVLPEAVQTAPAEVVSKPVTAPRVAVSKTASRLPETVQIAVAPSARFQPLDESTILEQRITPISKDRKKRELLVKTTGKYPFHRIEETLVRNEGSDTYTIAGRIEMVASHVLVKLQDGKTESDLKSMLAEYGVSVLRALSLPGHYIVALKAPTLDAAPEAVSVLGAERELFAYVEPDYLSRINTVPNDARWLSGDLWGLVKINATSAWDMTTGSTNVIVAVIDTGISLTHPDLSSNIWKNVAELNGTAGVDDDGNGFVDDTTGWDFVNNDKNPDDDNSHGTHCAGTIGAVGNNSVGVVGVCWKVRLMALKAGDSDGLLAISDTAEAVRYAADNGAKIISASYGGSGSSDTARDAISYANGKGVLFIAAAGNNGLDNDSTPHYPSSYDLPNVVSVAASDQSDLLASFSNYGKTSVDLAAPGVSIYSTVPGDSYEAMQGTSMATPHVAGAAALLLSAKPGLTHLQLKQALLNTVDPVSSLAAKTVSGGRLNVKKMIALQDTDGDGMPDGWEVIDSFGRLRPVALDPSDASDADDDNDGDGLSN
ncbi:MAG: S8 family serine peptidase, partial [Verrucomicrobia bacterium]|nr:S8 family serine peptidase [Verrucomicrobiota bacterium]